MATVEVPPRAPLRDDGLEAVRVLLLVQGGLAMLAAIEAGFWMAAAGRPTLVVSVALSAAGALAALVLAARIGRGGRWTRRLALAMELAIVAVTLVDIGLAVLFRSGSVGLMPGLTRVVIPIAVIGLLGRKGGGR